MEQLIIPHLWFDTQAVEAMNDYVEIFPGSKKIGRATLADTPSGEVDMVSFEIMGLELAAISAGPYFKINPAISFCVELNDETELRNIWNKLESGGSSLMPLQEYPFSPLFGWVQDKYGVSWQLFLNKDIESYTISTMLLFTQEKSGKAESAMHNFVKIFPETSIEEINYYPEGMEPEIKGNLMMGSAKVGNQSFLFMDSSQQHEFTFSEAVSLMVYCDSQEEIDYYWDQLSHVPEAEQCGWVCDQYGISWQIVPGNLNEKMFEYDWDTLQRVNKAIQNMKKLDIDLIQQAENDEV